MRQYLHTIPVFPGILCILAGCTHGTPMVNLGIDDRYFIPRMTKLPLRPELTGERYLWRVDGDSVADTREFIFLAAGEGTHTISLDIIDPLTPFSFETTVTVMHEDVEYSPYIARVYEYSPAPGQFVNEMPRYEEGDTYADILQKAEESISGTNDVMITLGAFGGYVTFGFDHTVVNIPGEPDFRIWGNCFYELLQPDKKGGSAEPGIVSVSYDVNCNGLPDDPWYELAGSDYRSPGTRHRYSIAYSRPDHSRPAVPDEDNSLDDIFYIPWTDNAGRSGFIPKNVFHSQDYFPRWIRADTLSFTGTLLPPNAEDISGNGSYYVLYSFPWGYVDNHPNEYADLNSFDISRAVDADGNPVNLPGADFIRVHTALNQCCGWLGETSTELSRAQDLHIALPGLPDPLNNNL